MPAVNACNFSAKFKYALKTKAADLIAIRTQQRVITHLKNPRVKRSQIYDKRIKKTVANLTNRKA